MGRDPARAYGILSENAQSADTIQNYGSVLSYKLSEDEALSLGAFLVAEEESKLRSKVFRSLIENTLNYQSIGNLGVLIERLSDEVGDSEFLENQIMSSSLTKKVDSAEKADEVLKLFQDNLPESLMKATRQMVEKWMEQDFNSAGEWILTLPESPERTQAIQTFIKEIGPLDQEAANEWARLLPE